jgi:hypothetical protein
MKTIFPKLPGELRFMQFLYLAVPRVETSGITSKTYIVFSQTYTHIDILVL